MNLAGRKAVVTGGAGALGSAVAHALLEIRVPVAIPMQKGHVAPQPAGVLGAECDLRDEAQVKAFFGLAAAKQGETDLLVNIAGGFAGGKLIEETTARDLDAMLELNLCTAHLACREVLGGMKKRGFGRIVNVAAMPALHPTARRGSYAIAKRGVVTLTEVIAEETRGTGVTCNAIAPSIIDTPANRKSMPDADPSRWVGPGEIASLILFLCSDEARSISGNVIRIYGGVE